MTNTNQITMTEIQNPKKLVFDLVRDFGYCNFGFICNLVLVICYFRFIRAECLSG